jgi:hypothetical protein
MSAKRILKEMITSTWGPYKDYSEECGKQAHGNFEFVCNEILTDILGIDNSPYNGLSATYSKDGDCLWIDLRFFNKATMDAQHIAFEFRERVDLAVRVFVSEQTSEFTSP